MAGYVFDIKRYAVNDGPGIRITIFFKGCPLSCIWCHNPEGMSPTQSKLYTAGRCIGCGLCIQACENGALQIGILPDGRKGVLTDSVKCVLCGACAAACPARAMEMAGKDSSTEELMREIRKEAVFFAESGGGVTVCGGEPLMQKERLCELLDACGREGFHRCVDTTLFAAPEVVREVASRCELFLVDLKIMDSCRHQRFTGVGNEVILENIELLASLGKEFVIRIPLIRGVNADSENLTASAEFLAGIQQRHFTSGLGFAGETDKDFVGKKIKVELLPYHDIAKGKHLRLGTVYNPAGVEMGEPSAQEMDQAKEIFIKYGLETGE